MLQATAFNGGEAALVMDDVDGVALQCWRRREKVRGESIRTERERKVVLTDDGRSRRRGRAGSGEGGELELGRGCRT
jgi:hypothetical protein